MWRDRTNLYISYRQSYTHHPTKRPQYVSSSSNAFYNSQSQNEERRGLISSSASEHDGDIIIEMDPLPPKWLDIQDEVTELLEDIARNNTSLVPLRSRHVLPGFGDDAVKRREEKEIEKLTQEITSAFQKCQRAIKRIGTIVNSAKSRNGISSSEEAMANNLQISLAARVGDASADFRKKQALYLKKLSALSGMAPPNDRSSPPTHINSYADPSLLESDADRSFSQTTLQQTAQKREISNVGTIAQREKEIEEIAQGIIELANIFQDLQTMVIDQGTMLDRIDYNVERMAVDVKAADKELILATGYQRRTTKRRIIFLLILIVAGMLILLLVKPRRQSV